MVTQRIAGGWPQLQLSSSDQAEFVICDHTIEEDGQVFGFVTFDFVPGRPVGFFDNNGMLPEKRGQGWGTFMYRHVLQHFRERGVRFVFVETDLDEPHVPARQAYEAVGFDSQQRIVIYRQDLDRHNPGSELKTVGHDRE